MAARLNIGCGSRFLCAWTNVDFSAHEDRIIAHDLRLPLPFGDGEFSFVYQSHVLEHLRPREAKNLLSECFRVLSPGGVLRVVVPDLEQKVRLYLQCLEAQTDDPSTERSLQHEWMILELIDQVVRESSGGEMARFMQSGRIAEFVRMRIGDEYEKNQYRSGLDVDSRGKRSGWGLKSWCRQTVAAWAMRLLGLDAGDVAAAKFHRSGEKHLWMYDRLSLGSLLGSCGFQKIAITDPFTSSKNDWATDGMWLDVHEGSARKPDSVYMEARRPI